MKAVSGLALKLSGQLEGPEIEEFLWLLAATDVLVRHVNGQFSLTGLDSVVAVVVDVEFGLNRGEFLGMALEQKVALTVSLGRGHVLVGAKFVLIVELDFYSCSWLVVAHQSSCKIEALIEPLGTVMCFCLSCVIY